jgi:hypothetical protein
MSYLAACGTAAPTAMLRLTTDNLMRSPLAPIPINFINSLDPYPGAILPYVDRIYIDINPEALVELGDAHRDFDENWISNFRLTLNDQEIFLDDVMFGTGGPLINYFDSGTNDRMGITNNASASIKIKPANGLNVVHIQTTTTLGRVIAYDWAFTVDPAIPPDYASTVRVKTDPISARRATLIADLHAAVTHAFQTRTRYYEMKTMHSTILPTSPVQ